MRGVYVLVSPPDALLEQVELAAQLFGVVALTLDADEVAGTVTMVMDPLGELRVDGPNTSLDIALTATARTRTAEAGS